MGGFILGVRFVGVGDGSGFYHDHWALVGYDSGSNADAGHIHNLEAYNGTY